MSAGVINGGVSDHDAIWQDFRFVGKGLEIRAAGYNTHHGSSWREVDEVFSKIMARRPSILILQEVKAKQNIVEGLHREYGLRYRTEAPEFAICWDPEEWRYLGHHGLLMSKAPYWVEEGNRALTVLLEHRESGEKLRTFSGHPPAHIVKKDHPSFDNVLEVHKDYAQKTRRIAARAQRNGIAFLGEEDLNIDLAKDQPVWKGTWNWHFPEPLDYVRAVDPTHGKRHIDSWRINELLRAA